MTDSAAPAACSCRTRLLARAQPCSSRCRRPAGAVRAHRKCQPQAPESLDQPARPQAMSNLAQDLAELLRDVRRPGDFFATGRRETFVTPRRRRGCSPPWWSSCLRSTPAASCVLASAAGRADCELHLAFLAISESGSAEYCGECSRGRHHSPLGDDDFEVLDICDRSSTLSGWQAPLAGDAGSRRRPADGAVSSRRPLAWRADGRPPAEVAWILLRRCHCPPRRLAADRARLAGERLAADAAAARALPGSSRATDRSTARSANRLRAPQARRLQLCALLGSLGVSR
ncbi:MAG: hypothetical protein AW08_03814 [Candidatus Accumulibacter adjunctus]|uniref:Uncharacterized protein n=1 Tax=Candidatus Accumulibacter adjunctus TaxID=1454001 RepID=A0A011PCW1_9PROT|nr:MAG: hypothetical protein AW08_03814 [Candidatus Accumulibacter adjunctus]